MKDSKRTRNIDRYLGAALCRLLSFCHQYLSRPLGIKHAVNSEKKRILIVELFEMGAAVMLIPSINYIREKHPEAEVYCLTTKTCAPLWKEINLLGADKIIVINSGSALRFMWDSLRKILEFRKLSFDLIIDYELFMRVPAILSACLKAKQRAGFYRYQFEGLYRGNFYNLKCAFNQNSHIAKNFLALTKVALEGQADLPNLKQSLHKTSLNIPPLQNRNSQSSLSSIASRSPEFVEKAPYIAVCPSVGNNLAVRNYPIPQLAEVLKGLLAENLEMQIVILGTAADQELVQELLNALNAEKSRCVNLCGKTSFYELLDVISEAEMLITNDNGPAHFAALTDTKVLALFSTDSPFVYGPLGKCLIVYSFFHCSPCISAFNHKSTLCGDNKCLQAIAPSTVLNFAREVLNSNARFGTINNSISYLH